MFQHKRIQKNSTMKIKNQEQIERENVRFFKESQHFLSLFPKEVWDHVCSFLNSEDFQNLNNCSPFFSELFSRKRVFLLFEPVLKIMLPKLGSYTKTPSNRVHQDHICRSVLINCRAACKSWKRSVDKMACIWNEEKQKKNSSVHQLLSESYKFGKYWQIKEFLQYFNTTHSSSVNPFPGKFMYLHVRLQEPDFQNFSKNVFILLQKYGHHLLTFGIYCAFDEIYPPETHQNIVEWLKLMPNLQNLKIYYLFPSRKVIEDQVLRGISPPELNLRKFVVKTFCPALPDVHIHDWSWLESYNLRKLIQYQQNLEHLQIVIFNKQDAEILKIFNSPLKSIMVKYSCKEDDVLMSEVFTMLNEKFSKSLEDLTIKFRVSNTSSGHLTVMQDSFNGRLNLPRVKKVKIRILSVYCLDFLLGMQDNFEELLLTCLTVRPRFYEYSEFSSEQRREIMLIESNQIIKFLGFQDKLLESNIWIVFPNLKRISLGNVSGKKLEFQRTDWVKLQRSNRNKNLSRS